MAQTAEQREAKHQARLERDRAWRARYKARQTAEKAGEDEIRARLYPAFEEAQQKVNQTIRERAQAVDAVELQISILRKDIDRIKHEYAAKIADEHLRSNLFFEPIEEARKALQARLEAEFPDFVGSARFSASCWKPKL